MWETVDTSCTGAGRALSSESRDLLGGLERVLLLPGPRLELTALRVSAKEGKEGDSRLWSGRGSPEYLVPGLTATSVFSDPRTGPLSSLGLGLLSEK